MADYLGSNSLSDTPGKQTNGSQKTDMTQIVRMKMSQTQVEPCFKNQQLSRPKFAQQNRGVFETYERYPQVSDLGFIQAEVPEVQFPSALQNKGQKLQYGGLKNVPRYVGTAFDKQQPVNFKASFKSFKLSSIELKKDQSLTKFPPRPMSGGQIAGKGSKGVKNKLKKSRSRDSNKPNGRGPGASACSRRKVKNVTEQNSIIMTPFQNFKGQDLLVTRNDPSYGERKHLLKRYKSQKQSEKSVKSSKMHVDREIPNMGSFPKVGDGSSQYLKYDPSNNTRVYDYEEQHQWRAGLQPHLFPAKKQLHSHHYTSPGRNQTSPHLAIETNIHQFELNCNTVEEKSKEDGENNEKETFREEQRREQNPVIEENAGITASEEEIIQEDIAVSPTIDINEHGGDEGEEAGGKVEEEGGSQRNAEERERSPEELLDDEGRDINPIDTRVDSEVGQNEEEQQQSPEVKEIATEAPRLEQERDLEKAEQQDFTYNEPIQINPPAIVPISKQVSETQQLPKKLVPHKNFSSGPAGGTTESIVRHAENSGTRQVSSCMTNQRGDYPNIDSKMTEYTHPQPTIDLVIGYENQFGFHKKGFAAQKDHQQQKAKDIDKRKKSEPEMQMTTLPVKMIKTGDPTSPTSNPSLYEVPLIYNMVDPQVISPTCYVSPKKKRDKSKRKRGLALKATASKEGASGVLNNDNREIFEKCFAQKKAKGNSLWNIQMYKVYMDKLSRQSKPSTNSNSKSHLQTVRYLAQSPKVKSRLLKSIKLSTQMETNRTNQMRSIVGTRLNNPSGSQISHQFVNPMAMREKRMKSMNPSLKYGSSNVQMAGATAHQSKNYFFVDDNAQRYQVEQKRIQSAHNTNGQTKMFKTNTTLQADSDSAIIISQREGQINEDRFRNDNRSDSVNHFEDRQPVRHFLLNNPSGSVVNNLQAIGGVNVGGSGQDSSQPQAYVLNRIKSQSQVREGMQGKISKKRRGRSAFTRINSKLQHPINDSSLKNIFLNHQSSGQGSQQINARPSEFDRQTTEDREIQALPQNTGGRHSKFERPGSREQSNGSQFNIYQIKKYVENQRRPQSSKFDIKSKMKLPIIASQTDIETHNQLKFNCPTINPSNITLQQQNTMTAGPQEGGQAAPLKFENGIIFSGENIPETLSPNYIQLNTQSYKDGEYSKLSDFNIKGALEKQRNQGGQQIFAEVSVKGKLEQNRYLPQDLQSLEEIIDTTGNQPELTALDYKFRQSLKTEDYSASKKTENSPEKSEAKNLKIEDQQKARNFRSNSNDEDNYSPGKKPRSQQLQKRLQGQHVHYDSQQINHTHSPSDSAANPTFQAFKRQAESDYQFIGHDRPLNSIPAVPSSIATQQPQLQPQQLSSKARMRIRHLKHRKNSNSKSTMSLGVHSGAAISSAYDSVRDAANQASHEAIVTKIKGILRQQNVQVVKMFQKQRDKFRKEQQRADLIYSNKKTRKPKVNPDLSFEATTAKKRRGISRLMGPEKTISYDEPSTDIIVNIQKEERSAKKLATPKSQQQIPMFLAQGKEPQAVPTRNYFFAHNKNSLEKKTLATNQDIQSLRSMGSFDNRIDISTRGGPSARPCDSAALKKSKLSISHNQHDTTTVTLNSNSKEKRGGSKLKCNRNSAHRRVLSPGYITELPVNMDVSFTGLNSTGAGDRWKPSHGYEFPHGYRNGVNTNPCSGLGFPRKMGVRTRIQNL